ncbi:MAG: hypothetical protein ABI699_19870 [Caldimonas sp.]
MSARLLTWLYLAWALPCIGIVLLRDPRTPDALTHYAVSAWLGLALLFVRWLRRLGSRRSPRLVFIAACVASAAVVEGCYMISAPLHPALRITAQTSAGEALRSLAIDLALTTPAYIAIFWAVSALLRRYAYRPIEFVVLMGAGQALGDGIAYLSANPGMLVFLPWLMVSYHAMTLAPYLALRDRLGGPTVRRRPAMFVLPLVVLPAVYWLAGGSIIVVGRALGWTSS